MPGPISQKHYKNNVFFCFFQNSKKNKKNWKMEKAKKHWFLGVFRLEILSLRNSEKVVDPLGRAAGNRFGGSLGASWISIGESWGSLGTSWSSLGASRCSLGVSRHEKVAEILVFVVFGGGEKKNKKNNRLSNGRAHFPKTLQTQCFFSFFQNSKKNKQKMENEKSKKALVFKCFST